MSGLALVPGGAVAATVGMRTTTERELGNEYTFGTVEISAAPGETNTIEVVYTPPTASEQASVTVTDTGTPPVAGERCEQVDADAVRCRDAEIVEIDGKLGDMADRFSFAGHEDLSTSIDAGAGNDELAATWGSFEGGAGNDVLTGAAGDDRLDGGPGDDVLEGHGERDYLDGGSGDDVLRGGAGGDSIYGGGEVGDPAPAGADELSGGPGNDTLSDQDELGASTSIGPDQLDGGPGTDFVYSYIARKDAVTVDLTRPGGQGREGENDTLHEIENVFGGDGADTLIGGAEANYLDGERGRDVVRGGGGDDELISNVNPRHTRSNRRARAYGPDSISGDAGDDLVRTLPTMMSKISCGAGSDAIVLRGYSGDKAPSSSGPLVSRSCERLSMSDAPSKRHVVIDPTPVRVGERALVFGLQRFRCCRQVMQVNLRKRVLATARLRRERIRLRVGREVIAKSNGGTVTLRGKISRVARNRFVWRFQIGEGAF